MDAAAAVLRELGEATGARPRSQGELTARETEVLGLLELGMSNARIAQTLVITEKTAGHHVSHILSKLGRAQPRRGGRLRARANREFSRCIAATGAVALALTGETRRMHVRCKR